MWGNPHHVSPIFTSTPCKVTVGLIFGKELLSTCKGSQISSMIFSILYVSKIYSYNAT